MSFREALIPRKSQEEDPLRAARRTTPRTKGLPPSKGWGLRCSETATRRRREGDEASGSTAGTSTSGSGKVPLYRFVEHERNPLEQGQNLEAGSSLERAVASFRSRVPALERTGKGPRRPPRDGTSVACCGRARPDAVLSAGGQKWAPEEALPPSLRRR